jgi:cell division protein ZapA (FtsZ GTPase activity inhibitor)
MNNEDNQGRDRDLRDRIVSLIRANQQAHPKPVPGEELEKLKAAATRLDQMLQSGADADRQALENAAARLDQLLTDIRKGKEVTLKMRGAGQKRKEEKA